MAVKIGSARIDENGKAYGGKAGDQTGKEVSRQTWYKHSKGWVVARPKSQQVADALVKAMNAACDNPHIGYDQWQRNTLYSRAARVGFDISQVTAPCETDCSALVRVCCAYAGITSLADDTRTTNLISRLAATGQFDVMTADKYAAKPDYLLAGDVLCTKKQGHTVIVLTDGNKAEPRAITIRLGDRTLRKGCEGADVEALQEHLINMGYNLPRYGADGEYGAETENAVSAFKAAHRLKPNGVYGKNAHKALEAEVAE